MIKWSFRTGSATKSRPIDKFARNPDHSSEKWRKSFRKYEIDPEILIHNILAATIGLASTFIVEPTAAAAQSSYPRIEGAIPIEIQVDLDYESDNPGNERNNLGTLIEPEVTIHFTSGLSLFAHAVLEQVADPGPNEDRFFRDQGLFIEDLYLAYGKEWFKIKAGKFTPNFGIAWHAAPGVYGTDFAEAGYEFAERIGFAGTISFKDKRYGAHRISASTFFLDTSVLAQSTFKTRGTKSLGDGGVSNTEDFSSFSVALSGEDATAIPGLGYYLAYIRQENGRDGTANESGLAVAATYVLKFGDGFELLPLAEFVTFSDADGTAGQDRDFLTLAGQLTWGNWNAAISFTNRNTDAADGTSTNDENFQISAGYAFNFGLLVDIAWRHVEEAEVDTEGVGVLFAYTIHF